MSKKSIVLAGGAAGAIIAILIASYAVNTYALNSLQFRLLGGRNCDFASLRTDMQIEACNPTVFPAPFDRYHMVMLYKGQNFAIMDLKGGTVNPKQTTILDGNIAVDRGVLASLLVQGLSDACSGTGQTETSQDDFGVKINLEAKVLGFIPYTETKAYTINEFQNKMNSQNPETFSCYS